MAETPTDIFAVPDGVWILNILPVCTPRSLHRLAQVSRYHRALVDEYVKTWSYGRRLALTGVESLRDRLLKKHARCGGDELPSRVDAYLARVCILCHQDPPAVDTGDEAAETLARSAADITGGRTPQAIIRDWSREELSRFLLIMASQIGGAWPESSHGMAWALQDRGLKTLATVLLASSPRDALLELGGSPDHASVAHLVSSVCALRGSRPYNEATESGLIPLTKAVLQQIDAFTGRVGVKSQKNIEFALAAGGVALAHGLKVLPTRRSLYLECVRGSFERKGLPEKVEPAIDTAVRDLGLAGPGFRVKVVSDFDCGSASGIPSAGLALLAATLAGGGGAPIVIPLGPAPPGGPPPAAMLDLLGAILAAGPPDDGDDDDE